MYKVPYEEPRPLEKDELPGVVNQFVTASKNALACGFDGIELHGGLKIHYLLDLECLNFSLPGSGYSIL